jgi:Holliday junction resolvase RusA-like endonuclease
MAVAKPQPVIIYAVPGAPAPWERPRARVGKEGEPRVVFFKRKRSESPLKTYQEAFVDLGKAHRNRTKGWPLDGVYEVDLLFVCPRDLAPAGLLPAKGPRAWMGKKPDLDNYVKGVLDALNKVLWKDDQQVVDLRVVKVFAASDERPHTKFAARPKGDRLPGLDCMF